MDLLAKVTFQTDTGQVKDNVTNSFAFNAPGADPDLGALSLALQAFYNSVPAGGLSYVAAFFSSVMKMGVDQCSIDFYNLTGHLGGTPVGSPIYSDSFDLAGPAASTDFPSEVAYVLQLRAAGRAAAAVETPDDGDADAKPQRPKQRHTGRLYLGPLNSTAAAVVDYVVRPSAAIRDTSRLAALALQDAAAAEAMTWCVWSRKDAVLRTITSVANDNAFDTQRRRGEAPTITTETLI